MRDTSETEESTSSRSNRTSLFPSLGVPLSSRLSFNRRIFFSEESPPTPANSPSPNFVSTSPPPPEDSPDQQLGQPRKTSCPPFPIINFFPTSTETGRERKLSAPPPILVPS